jgi:predicted  nucleic acid-binding Zn-ribbon protein
VQQLLGEVKQQLAQKSFLDTQVNELQKRSKSLGRTADNLQATIDEMRAKQKMELAAVDQARDRMQRLEAETAALREQIQAAASPRTAAVSAEDLRALLRKISNLEEQIRVRCHDHERLVADLQTRITDYNRRVDDASSADAVMKKKTSQKVSALQTEINKRRGIVVHSSRRRTSGTDAAQLFLESKRLIQELATKQQDVWELEERVPFARNSLELLAADLVKRLLGKLEPAKAAQTAADAKEIVLALAGMNRQKKVLLAATP